MRGRADRQKARTALTPVTPAATDKGISPRRRSKPAEAVSDQDTLGAWILIALPGAGWGGAFGGFGQRDLEPFAYRKLVVVLVQKMRNRSENPAAKEKKTK